jgi:hypothetical protein
MRLTRVDFVAPAARLSRIGAILFVVGVLFAGTAVMDDSSRSDELTRSQEQLEKTRASLKRAEAALAPDQGSELAGFKQSGDIARRLVSPWGELLDALEHADNDDVALLAVESDAERGRLRLSGEAKNLDALVEYIKALEGSAGITDLRLMTQQVKQNDPQHPVEFVIDSIWLRRPQRANVNGASS